MGCILTIEYAYGGHAYSYTGVYSMVPRQEESISTEGGIQFRESLKMGYTFLSSDQVSDLVQSLGQKYNGNAYHIFQKYVVL